MRKFLVVNLNSPSFVRPPRTREGKFEIALKDTPREGYDSLSLANEAALGLAKKNPGNTYVVMAPIHIFEAQVPKVIEKIFNDQGEMVVKPE